MRSSFASARGSPLLKSPSHRQQATRRWLAVICAVLGLALVSGVIGSFIQPAHPLSSRPATGPFSYIPSQ